jgi:phosphopantothenoylcysteine decarboxylase/phosphopantothenate--cysteine ligase
MTDDVSDHYRLRGRRVLLGITAGVAAYKAAELARLLVKAGASVRAVMTPSAHEFIGAQTLQAITGEPVRDAIFDPEHEAAMGHIELARWADAILVAPATADFLAKLHAGHADTLLHTLCLASEAPLAVAPAMNEKMWKDPATQANVNALRERGVAVFGPATGEQACGDVGPGRMLEPVDLLRSLEELFGRGRFYGRKVVLTAGPTREPLDAVRFLGNRSSGKMGYAIAEALLREGADLTLVSGPVSLAAPAGARLVAVETAQQMHDAVMQVIADADLFVACAAVADYRPAEMAEHKIKKTADHLTVQLVKNPDILRDVAALPEAPFCVGFAAETQNLEQYAEGKRRDKGIAMIAANQVGESQGFEADDNALLVLWEGGRCLLPQQPKSSLAEQLVSLIADRIDAQTTTENTG